jgi:hypothetical protein
VSGREPDFERLVGGDDLDVSERERLRRVHELLIAAGPPPDLSPLPVAPAPVPQARIESRRRRLALVALAAALALAIFGAGFLLGDRGGPGTFDVVALTGTSRAASAHASLAIFDIDEAGNWPMEIEVEGLASSENDRAYELWLTKDGRLAALCGSFLVEPNGKAKIPLNAPYRLRDFDKWVVVEEGSETPLLTT